MTARKTTSKPSLPEIEIVPADRLRPDPDNANRHTQEGQRIVTDSIRRNRFGRPGLATKDGKVIAGNLSVLEVAAGDLGAEEIILIKTDGSRPVVHVRTDLEDDSPEAVELALADNRASEVSLDWNPEIIQRIKLEHPEMVEGLWNPRAMLELQTQDVPIPVTDMEQETWEKSVGFGRFQAAQTGIVAGFGRYASLVPAQLVDRIIQLIKANYGENPDEGLPRFFADMLVQYLGGDWPPELEVKNGKG